MAKKLQLRRGTTSQHSSFTGDVGECTVDTTKDTLVVHDGAQAGGRPLAREDLSNVSSATIISNISDGSITNAKLGADAVNASKIADNSIDSEHYVDGSIDTAHIANGAITNAKLGADSVNATKIADNSIGSEHIANSNVTTVKLADGAVTNAKIGADAVNSAKISDNSIDSEHYVDGSIDAAHIADSAVTEPKLSTTNAGSTGQFLQKTGASTMDWATVSTQAFPSGTLMLFQQSTAPTGWTKQTTHNDKALRVVSGTASSGGGTAFSSIFGSSVSTNAHTLSTSEMPAHTHSYPVLSGSPFYSGNPYSLSIVASSGTITLYGNGTTYYTTTGTTTQSTGGGGAHSHTMSMDLQFVDLIIAAHN